MKISYLITTKNETNTLIRLLEKLVNNKFLDDELVIIDDFSDDLTTKKLLSDVSRLKNVFVYQHSLNNDYGSHKNFGNEKCSGDWIFQCDADELPSDTLIFNMREIIETNKDIELIFVPRINDFRGVTEDDAKQWGWHLSPSPTYENRPIVNWPDYQSRIYKRDTNRIKWDRKLHEKIVGHDKYAFLPAEEDLALYHDKTIETQRKTNLRYNEKFSVEDNLGHKVI
jgi:glycosyltransferase involved in cell wall biosynthesis